MPAESQIPIASQGDPRRFAGRLKLFYAAEFSTIGTHLPFFTVWLKAIGIDPSWIGIISAVPSVTRFTVLPLVTGSAEKRHSLRGALIATAFATAIGFSLVGTQQRRLRGVPRLCRDRLRVDADGAADRCLCAARRGALRPELRAAAAMGLGGLRRRRAGLRACWPISLQPRHLIWVIASVAGLGAIVSLGLQPLDQPRTAPVSIHGAKALLRDPGFLAIILAAALIQGSHAAYYTFASITWQASGLGGLTIAGLWTLGVLAEIVVFALSPRFTLSPAVLVVIGGLSAVVRWLITAQEPSVAVLAVVQLTHGLTYGLTQVGTMGLLVRHVPGHVMARGRAISRPCSGIVSGSASILSGVIYARYGQGVYYVMAAMALSGAIVIWLARHRLADHHLPDDQPQSAASGG